MAWHVDVNASHILTSRPSSGRNCPACSHSNPALELLSNELPCASACSLAGVHVPGTNRSLLRVTYIANTPVALARWKSLQMTKLLRPYLKSPLIEWSHVRSVDPMEVARAYRTVPLEGSGNGFRHYAHFLLSWPNGDGRAPNSIVPITRWTGSWVPNLECGTVSGAL